MTFTKRTVFLVILFLPVSFLYAQQKYALVIGNGNYTGISRLNNPVNDANDMEAALRDLGFTVDKVLNGNLTDMENAIIRLKNRLSVTQNSYGFLFYAGHGVQSNGVNYLIPVGVNIPSESFLRERSVSVQAMLDELNEAGNTLNIVVLDACRDNPFSWARSGSRGLTVLSNQPADSIIVYATSAGSTASDGTGRNGLFTSHLLNNLKTPGLEITEVFRLTGAAVSQASSRQQIPAIYNQFFGTAYLGSRPTAPTQIVPQSAQGVRVWEETIYIPGFGNLRYSLSNDINELENIIKSRTGMNYGDLNTYLWFENTASEVQHAKDFQYLLNNNIDYSLAISSQSVKDMMSRNNVDYSLFISGSFFIVNKRVGNMYYFKPSKCTIGYGL